MKNQHVVLEIVNGNVEYICNISAVYKDSTYKYAFDKNNFPLKTKYEIYWNKLLDIKRYHHGDLKSFMKEYDKLFSTKDIK